MIMLLELTMLVTNERSRSQGMDSNREFSYLNGVAFSFSQNIGFTYWDGEEI